MLTMLLGQDIAEKTPENPQQNSKGRMYENCTLKNPLWKLSGFELHAAQVSWSCLILIPMYFKTETNATHWDTNIQLELT